MDRIDNLTAIVRREVSEYATWSSNSSAYYVENPTSQVYAVLVIPEGASQKSTIMIMARVADERVIIETDKTDRPLFEALIHAGVPQNQIVLAYTGETEPMA